MWSRTWLATAAALVTVVLTGGPASALPVPTVPEDVRAVSAGAGLRQAQAGAEGLGADFSGDVRAEDVHELFRFSMTFVDEGPVTEPVVSTGQWVAALERGDEVLGTLGVWRPDGGRAQPNGYSDDVALGAALGAVSATELLIHDAPNGAYYALSGTTVRPLNDWARKALPGPAELAELRTTVVEQYDVLRSQPTDHADPPALPVSLLAMALAVAIAGGLLALERRRRRSALRS
ncbi:hypothetical protein E4P39_16020 [Blastococcus sp. CT_GayMR19]|uniref:hypothetical protein n=1 Tax=Blastococcus sp. CT_GayMR19 TaxID=2559608 RepID=UPI001073F26D|nr:hypothetical protein [Blastococcus sp. CT_GayMR19]TFV72985.1 hypothetical protein E4P39_16020 [Blastococcus sp. CT_GayMR19]